MLLAGNGGGAPPSGAPTIASLTVEIHLSAVRGDSVAQAGDGCLDSHVPMNRRMTIPAVVGGIRAGRRPAGEGAFECGTSPANGGDIICDENDQTNAGSSIEYDFAAAETNSYTIKVQGTIEVDTTVDGNAGRGLDASHGGTGDLTINMSDGNVETQGSAAEGISGEHSGNGSRNLTIEMSDGTIQDWDRIRSGHRENCCGHQGSNLRRQLRRAHHRYVRRHHRDRVRIRADAGRFAYGIYAIKHGSGTSDITLPPPPRT